MSFRNTNEYYQKPSVYHLSFKMTLTLIDLTLMCDFDLNNHL